MSLQRRLTLFFVLIVILPLVAAGFVVQKVVVDEVARRSLLSLGPALDAATTLYNARVQVLEPQVQAAIDSRRFAGLLERSDTEGLNDYLASHLRGPEGADFLLVLDEAGAPIAFARRAGDFVPGFELSGPQEIVATDIGVGPGFTRTREMPVRIAGSDLEARVIGGFWLDEDLLLGAPQGGVELSVAVGGRIVSSTAPITAPAEVDVTFGRDFEVDIGGAASAEAKRLDRGVALVASTLSEPIDTLSRRVLTSVVGLLTGALILTTILAYFLAQLITQPLDELAEGAAAISEGRFEHIPVRSRDEVGQLAVAFNHMTDRLKSTITQLSSSRDQLQRSVRRVGETLRSTHDMQQMREAILLTAFDAVGAEAACLWMFTPTRDELHPIATAGITASDLGRITVGEGIAGVVAERAAALMLPATGGPHPARGEPAYPVVIAVPMYSEDRIIAVLAAYRRDSSRPFSREDLDTVVFLAEQGGVAIENVLLHEEARRLSITDGLTGVWNRRYFQMQFRQVLATAMRFERAFSVLMLDLDHFKQMNDAFGHQRGDAILIEFSQRVKENLREVDTFARWGGEEFVCLLPETDEEGATTTAEKIREAVRTRAFGGLGDEPVEVTVSIGVAAYPKDGGSLTDLIEGADKAMYLAKQTGRDRVCLAGQVEPGPPDLKIAT